MIGEKNHLITLRVYRQVELTDICYLSLVSSSFFRVCVCDKLDALSNGSVFRSNC